MHVAHQANTKRPSAPTSGDDRKQHSRHLSSVCVAEDACQRHLRGQFFAMQKLTLALGLFGLFGVASVEAAPPTHTVTCEVNDIVDNDAFEYRTILRAEFRLDAAQLREAPRPDDTSCQPTGQKSRTFGQRRGTRLQLAAWKCSSADVYFSQKLIVNGLPIVADFHDLTSRISVNEDPTSFDPEFVAVPKGESVDADAAIQLPEGRFRWVSSTCQIRTN